VVEIFLGEASGITVLEVAITETTKNKGRKKKHNKDQSALQVGKCNDSEDDCQDAKNDRAPNAPSG
jgi:hypothetical protein